MAHVTRGQGICAIVFGILKLLLGIAIIIVGFVVMKKVDNSILGSYWGGFIYIVPGILGIIAGATKNNCCMVAYMVINIILFILVGICSIVIFIAVGVYSTVIQDVTNNCSPASNATRCVCSYQGRSFNFGVSCDVIANVKSALWAIAVVYLLAGILLLASSILGCVSSCCTQPPPTGFIYQEQPPAQYQPSVVISSQQQMAAGYSPPAYTPPAKPGMI